MLEKERDRENRNLYTYFFLFSSHDVIQKMNRYQVTNVWTLLFFVCGYMFGQIVVWSMALIRRDCVPNQTWTPAVFLY
jgi:hypothetical protein